MSVCPLNTQLMDICILIYSGCLEKDQYWGLYMHGHGSLCTLDRTCGLYGNTTARYRWVNLMYTIQAYEEFHNHCLFYCLITLFDSWKVFIFVIVILAQIGLQVHSLTNLWRGEYNKYKTGVSTSCQQEAFTVASFVLWHWKRSWFSDGLQTCFLLLQPSLLWYLQNALGKSRDYHQNESCKALKTNRHFTCL